MTAFLLCAAVWLVATVYYGIRTFQICKDRKNLPEDHPLENRALIEHVLVELLRREWRAVERQRFKAFSKGNWSEVERLVEERRKIDRRLRSFGAGRPD